MKDTTQLIAIIVLAAFAIERVVAAAKFSLQPVPEGNARAQRRRELLLFALAGSIALAVVDLGGVRIIARLQPHSTALLVDYWLTWLVVVAGSDRVHEFLPTQVADVVAPKESKATVPPITFVFEDGKSVQRVAA